MSVARTRNGTAGVTCVAAAASDALALGLALDTGSVAEFVGVTDPRKAISPWTPTIAHATNAMAAVSVAACKRGCFDRVAAWRPEFRPLPPRWAST